VSLACPVLDPACLAATLGTPRHDTERAALSTWPSSRTAGSPRWPV